MKKAGPALLIGVMSKGKDSKKDGAYKEESEGMAEGDDASKEAKTAAAKALISAMKAGDAEALSEALDAYMSC